MGPSSCTGPPGAHDQTSVYELKGTMCFFLWGGVLSDERADMFVIASHRLCRLYAFTYVLRLKPSHIMLSTYKYFNIHGLRPLRPCGLQFESGSLNSYYNRPNLIVRGTKSTQRILRLVVTRNVKCRFTV